MATNIDRITGLLLRLHRGELSPEEQSELNAWRLEEPDHEQLYDELTSERPLQEQLRQLDSINVEAIRQRIQARWPDVFDEMKMAEIHPRRKVLRLVVRWTAAAVFIGLLGVGLRHWLFPSKPAAPVAITRPDVAAPTGSHATITLAGGQQISLDSADMGAIARQGSVRIVKQAGGHIGYVPEMRPSGTLLYNTLNNPRGSRLVTLTLADGTRVWLNTASSIRYPVLFSGTDRTVEVTGEAYFDVAPDVNKPFYVTVKGRQKVAVLGTTFNVDAYEDEPEIRTTLLSGAVRVSSERERQKTMILHPGEQAVIAVSGSGNPGDMKIVREVNVDQVLAWKNGVFAFAHADLHTVLRQLARWYDLTVVYEGPVAHRAFNGKLPQSLTLDQVLQILTNHQIHYTIEPGRRLVIRP